MMKCTYLRIIVDLRHTSVPPNGYNAIGNCVCLVKIFASFVDTPFDQVRLFIPGFKARIIETTYPVPEILQLSEFAVPPDFASTATMIPKVVVWSPPMPYFAPLCMTETYRPMSSTLRCKSFFIAKGRICDATYPPFWSHQVVVPRLEYLGLIVILSPNLNIRGDFLPAELMCSAVSGIWMPNSLDSLKELGDVDEAWSGSCRKWLVTFCPVGVSCVPIPASHLPLLSIVP